MLSRPFGSDNDATMPNTKIDRIFNKRFLTQGVFLLMGGTAFGQILSVLFSPLLSRLYLPVDFGLLAFYTAIITVIGSIASMSYHQAIPLPACEDDAVPILIAAIGFILATVGVVSIVLLFFSNQILGFLDGSKLRPFVWMVPLGILGLALYETCTQWAIRSKAFGVIALTSTTKALGQTGTQIGMGFLSTGACGLLAGQLVGQWVGVGRLAGISLKSIYKVGRPLKWDAVAEALREYRRFPAFATPTAMLNTLSTNAPPILLTVFFGGATAGLYAFGQRVVMLPISMVAKSYSQVFLSTAADDYRKGILSEKVGAVVHRLLSGALPVAALFAIVAPEAFAAIFGEEWRKAGVYSSWLCPWMLLVLLAMPISPLVAVLQKQKAGLIFQIVLLVSRAGAIFIGGLAKNAELAIGLFAVSGIICWGTYWLWLLHISKALKPLLQKMKTAHFVENVLCVLSLAAVKFLTTNAMVLCVFSLLLILLSLYLAYFRKESK